MIRTAFCLCLLSASNLLLASGNDPEWREILKAADEDLAERDLLTAVGRLETAFELAKEFGPDDPRLGHSACRLGGVYAELGRFAEAKKLYQLALPIFHQLQDDGLDQLAYAHRQIADLDYFTGDYAAAEEGYRKALKIYEVQGNRESANVAACLYGLARVCRQQGKLEIAELSAREAIRQANALEKKPDNIASIFAELGYILAHKGDAAGAESIFKQSLEYAIKSHGEIHRETAHLLRGYASLLRATAREKLADVYVARAAHIEREVP